MSLFTAVFIYFLIWWVMLFTVLPFGITRNREDGKGFDPGAPAKTGLKKKLLINTVISAAILGVIQLLVVTGALDWQEMFEEAWK